MPIFSYVYRLGAGTVKRLNDSTGLSSIALDALSVIEVAVVFLNELSSDEKGVVDDYMESRNFEFYRSMEATAKFLASSLLVNQEVAITETTNWQILGGVVTNVEFFTKNLSKVIGEMLGSFKTAGTGTELRIVEEATDGSEIVVATATLPDYSGAWTVGRVPSAVVPRSGTNTYRLEGRLNGATSAALRFCTISLLETL